MPKPSTKSVYSLLLANYTPIFLIVGIFLCGISTIIPWELLAHIVRDAGIAALIGIYLMWTLEQVNKLRVQQEVHEFIETVGESFIQAVYGRELPPELFDVICKSLFNQSFIYTAHHTDLIIQDFNDASIAAAPPGVRKLLESFREHTKNTSLSAENLIILRISTYVEVKNVSQTTAEYPLKFQTPKPFGGNYEGLCGITSVRIDGQEQLATEVYNRDADPETNPTLLEFSRNALVAPGATVKVSTEAYSLRRNDDAEQLRPRFPAKGVNLSVMDSDGNKDIVISLNAPLLEGTETFAVKNEKTNKAKFSVAQYLLPYQSVEVIWTPKRREKEQQPSLQPELPSAGT